jgi:hypothetical protein
MHANTRNTRRQSERHTLEIPINISIPGASSKTITGATHDISKGGLAFISDVSFAINQTINVLIQITRPFYEETARVIWSKPKGNSYEIGVQFNNANALYRLKMLEQVKLIEQYRQDMKTEQGVELSPEEAAMEWISKYAKKFREPV